MNSKWLHNLYSSPNIISVGGICSTHGTDDNEYNILIGKPEEKRQLERPRHRRQDNIRKGS